MNLFAPQNEQTMSELLDLALVPYLIITPRDGKPIVELVQDTMLGSYRITKDWVYIGDKTMANLQMVNSYFDGIMPKPIDEINHLYSGKQAFSQILPPGLFIDTKNDLDEKFIINNSIIEKGTIDKSVFHSMSRGILSVLFHDYNPFEAQRFLDNTQRLICRWLVYGGFSVGISDLITDKSTAESIKKTITKYKTDAYLKIENVRKGILDNKSIFKNQEFFELEILNILNQLSKDVGKIGTEKIDDKTNRMINMVKAKAKGKKDNVAQMVGCVGQQNVDGKRVAYGFTDRTLPHYTKYDDGPEARGFVENSFISGLTPQEVFFHAMGGREGLIDTAVKSVTGDTEIIIIENGQAKSVQIGKWIDSYLDNVDNLLKIEFSKVANQELLTLSDKVYIPTCDEKGKVTWGELTAITRHDPGEKLYKFKTLGGRNGIIADSKTLLIWDEKLKEFHQMESKEVKEGMYIPVTAELSESPIIINEIDMSIYFPKDEYIHGTEFNKAISMMNEAMKERIQIPRGWWEEHNGKSFITPYRKKASLTRVISGRSNTENIHDECIYPYHASRDTCRIPAKFKLDYDNGRFVGLFLADGHADLHSGQIVITKKDEDVIAFVKGWFDKYAINSKTKTDKKIRGETTTTSGYSTLLTIFMTKLVGHGSANKYIPDIAYTAPIEFVKGLISGYFSGDGHVDKSGIIISSGSRNLIEGISLLCSRIDVFGKISITEIKSNNLETENILPIHKLSIRAQWARKFRDNIDLIQKYKNNALKEINSMNLHCNFPYQNNVVLDKIVEMNEIISSNYQKLYDVTVPSTLNFQTKNGVNYRDTSETGYIQRRLIKAMEDEKIYCDQTVRNAAGSIIQYLYGEDGIDGTKIENQYIPYISMSLVEIDAKYYLRPEDPIDIYLTPEALSNLKTESEWIEKAKKHYEEIIDDRDFLINKVFKKEKIEKIQYAIPFDRIINNSIKRLKVLGSTATQTDLTPKYILDKIDEMINNLVIIRPNQGIRFLHILLRLHLSPKVIIFEKHLSKPVFDWITSEIEKYFIQSIACASEMVGIIAAQSIGEIGTQQSTPFWSHIFINSPDCDFSGKIGEFIDKLMKDNKEDIIDLGNDSCVLKMKETDDYKILGVSENEKVAWNRISAVSRHPVNGQVMKITTRSGKTTTCTLSHSFLKRAEKGIVPVLGSDLVIGDRVPIARCIPEIDTPESSVIIGDKTYPLDKEFGWICGVYLADGSLGTNYVTISKIEQIFEDRIRAFGDKYKIKVSVTHKITKNNKHSYMTLDPNKEYPSKDTKLTNKDLKEWIESNFGRGSYNKRVGGFIFGTNKEFIAGIISGYFDGDGSISDTKQMIRAHSVNEGLIDDIIVLLAYHKIFASKLNQTRNREKANVMWEVSINKKYSPIFKESIGIYTPHKSENLDKIISYLDNVKQQQDYIDMIPELSDILEMIGRKLEFPGQSRLYGRYKRLGINKIGRDSIIKYIELFENENNKRKNGPIKEVTEGIEIMKQAAESDVVYDEILNIEYSEYPEKYVYDFTVPGNDSFMIDCGVMVHNTLDSFHASGTAAAVKATSGVPRLKELLSVSKNIKTPALIIYLKKDIGSVINPNEDSNGNINDDRVLDTKMQCIKIMQQLEITRMKDILESTDIYWDPPSTTGLNTGIEIDDKMLEVYRIFSELDIRQRSSNPWVLRMKLNKKKMHNLGLTMMDIFIKIDITYHQTIDCIFSDDNADELIFRIRMTDESSKDIYPDDSIAALKAIEFNLVNNVLLKGLKGIKKVSMRLKTRNEYDITTDKFNKIAEWVIDTDGTNLQEILANPNIDQVRTRSNDINEIYKTLGIEAARNALYEEFIEIFQSEDAVNYRHMSLLLDTMANKGVLMSIDRHGINRGDVGPLAKSSFEETTDMLINASIFGENDKVNGVSANIMLGQMPPCGTGDTEVILDEDYFIQLMKEMGKDKGDTDIVEEYGDIAPQAWEKQKSCSADSLALKFNAPPPLKQKTKKTPDPKITFK